jgi:hypothetical protein
MTNDPVVPTPEELMWPALRALKGLGGSASHQELLEKVVELEKILTCPPVPSNIVPEFMLDSICRFAVI